jgi:hypothetical protein
VFAAHAATETEVSETRAKREKSFESDMMRAS